MSQRELPRTWPIKNLIGHRKAAATGSLTALTAAARGQGCGHTKLWRGGPGGRRKRRFQPDKEWIAARLENNAGGWALPGWAGLGWHGVQGQRGGARGGAQRVLQNEAPAKLKKTPTVTGQETLPGTVILNLRLKSTVTLTRFLAHMFRSSQTHPSRLPCCTQRGSWAPVRVKPFAQPHYCVWVCVFTSATHGARAAGSTRAWLLFRSLTPNATSRPPAQAALIFTPSLLRVPFP
jgi:hypothetical protein